VSRTQGISEAELRALAAGEWGDLFTPRERAALDFARVVAVSNTVPDEIFEPVRTHFSEEEIIELSATITFEICVAKFNRALEIEWDSTCPL
jgi:alkylhydroperoxidase family enzyme